MILTMKMNESCCVCGYASHWLRPLNGRVYCELCFNNREIYDAEIRAREQLRRQQAYNAALTDEYLNSGVKDKIDWPKNGF